MKKQTATENIIVFIVVSILIGSLVYGLFLDSSTIKQNNVKFLALGDSYTIGEGVQANESWPIQLKNSLSIQNVLIKTVDIIAETDELRRRNAIPVRQAQEKCVERGRNNPDEIQYQRHRQEQVGCPVDVPPVGTSSNGHGLPLTCLKHTGVEKGTVSLAG